MRIRPLILAVILVPVLYAAYMINWFNVLTECRQSLERNFGNVPNHPQDEDRVENRALKPKLFGITSYPGNEAQILTFRATNDRKGNLLYDWNFGDGSLLEHKIFAVSHSYHDNRLYTVSVTQNDLYTESVLLRISNVIPHATGVTIYANSNPVMFIGFGSDISESWDTLTFTWNFGSSSIATTSQATYSYTNTGIYTVLLQVMDENSGTTRRYSTFQVTYTQSRSYRTRSRSMDTKSHHSRSRSGRTESRRTRSRHLRSFRTKSRATRSHHSESKPTHKKSGSHSHTRTPMARTHTPSNTALPTQSLTPTFYLISDLSSPYAIVYQDLYMYWTSITANYPSSRVFSCPLSDCATPTLLYSTASPFQTNDIVVNSDNIFFSSDLNIYKCDLSGCGSSPTALCPGVSPQFLAIDNSNVYFTIDSGASSGYVAYFSTSAISCDLTILASGLLSSLYITVDSENVYFSEEENIYICAITGCSLSPSLVVSGSPIGVLVVSDAFLYWLSPGSQNHLYKCSTAGCGSTPTLLASYVPTPTLGDVTGLAIYNEVLYWASGSPNSQIISCSISGCGMIPTPVSNIRGTKPTVFFTIADTSLYWTNGGSHYTSNDGSIEYCNLH